MISFEYRCTKILGFGGLKLIKTMTINEHFSNDDFSSGISDFTVTKNNAGVPIYKVCLSVKSKGLWPKNFTTTGLIYRLRTLQLKQFNYPTVQN